MAYDPKADAAVFYANGPKGYRAEIAAMMKGLPLPSVKAREKDYPRKRARPKCS